jgi:tetratricopeptide (TPR) repeat protein
MIKITTRFFICLIPILVIFYFSLSWNSAQKHLQVGKILRENGNYKQALFHFRQALQKDPNLAEVNLEIGRLYFIDPNLVSLDEAIYRFTKEIEISNHPYAYHERGILFGYLKKWKEAEADFRKEISLWDNWAGYLDLAWILFSQNRLNEAEELMKIVDQKMPNSVWSLNGLGIIHLNQGKYDLAINELEMAFEKAKDLSYNDYIMAYPGNDPKLAFENIENIKIGIAFNLALAYEKNKNLTKALIWYNKTKELLKERPSAKVAEGLNLAPLDFKIKEIYDKINKNEGR